PAVLGGPFASQYSPGADGLAGGVPSSPAPAPRARTRAPGGRVASAIPAPPPNATPGGGGDTPRAPRAPPCRPRPPQPPPLPRPAVSTTSSDIPTTTRPSFGSNSVPRSASWRARPSARSTSTSRLPPATKTASPRSEGRG